MAQFLKPRVKETTTTTGTGTYQLDGAPASYWTFLDSFGNGAACYYMVFSADGATYEYGLGTINSSNQLARLLVINSSAGGAAVNWSAGTKTVLCAIPPEACMNNGSQALTNNAPTPSVKGGNVWLSNYTSPTNVTDFTNGIDGQIIVISATTANMTVVHGTPIKLSGGSNFTFSSNDTLTLARISGTWYEVARSVNT